MNPGLAAGIMLLAGTVIIMLVLVLEAFGVFDRWYK